MHNDTHASMTIYGDFAYCHVCCVNMSTAELNLPEYKVVPKPEPTNISNMIKHIESLPKKNIRGHELHYDSSGFYLIWPFRNYYKKRTNSDKARYVGPAGHRAPLFVHPGSGTTLIVCEGELNSMSLAAALDHDYTVVSPGSASEFMRHVASFKLARKVILIMDYDAAGICLGSQVKEVLLKHNVSTKLILLKKDFNQIHQDEGLEAVRAEFEGNL